MAGRGTREYDAPFIGCSYGKAGGVAMTPSCYFRYMVHPLVNTLTFITIIVALLLVVALIIFIANNLISMVDIMLGTNSKKNRYLKTGINILAGTVLLVFFAFLLCVVFHLGQKLCVPVRWVC